MNQFALKLHTVVFSLVRATYSTKESRLSNLCHLQASFESTHHVSPRGLHDATEIAALCWLEPKETKGRKKKKKEDGPIYET